MPKKARKAKAPQAPDKPREHPALAHIRAARSVIVQHWRPTLDQRMLARTREDARFSDSMDMVARALGAVEKMLAEPSAEKRAPEKGEEK